MRNILISLAAFFALACLLLQLAAVRRGFEEDASRLRLASLKLQRVLEADRARIRDVEALRLNYERNASALESKLGKLGSTAMEGVDPAALGPEEEGSWPDERPYFYLAKKHLRWLSYPALGSDHMVHSAAAALLGMTDAEKRSIDSTLASMLQRAREDDLRASHYTNPPAYANPYHGEKVSVFVPANQNLDQMRNTTDGAVGQILGPERATLFLERARESQETFGLAPNGRTMTYVVKTPETGTLTIGSPNGQSYTDVNLHENLDEAAGDCAHVVRSLILPKLQALTASP